MYEKHHNVPQSNLHDIDWEGNKLALSTEFEASYRKTFHKLRNTMVVNKRWKRIDSDLCPLCSTHPETIRHLLSCKHVDMTNVRNTQINKFLSTLKRLNTNHDMLTHWTNILNYITTESNIIPPKLSMNPSSWKLIQTHQQQSKIGWTCFMNGMISKKWSAIQKQHYESNPKDGENIFRWKRLVLCAFMDILRELWKTQCDFIHAETILTERDMLTRRTLQYFRDHLHLKQLIPLIDRHLFNKKENYFMTSSRETLELWETRAIDAIKLINAREPSQPTIDSITSTIAEAPITITFQKASSNTCEKQYDKSNNKKKRIGKKRGSTESMTHTDPLWNKRLRISRNVLPEKRRLTQTEKIKYE